MNILQTNEQVQEKKQAIPAATQRPGTFRKCFSTLKPSFLVSYTKKKIRSNFNLKSFFMKLNGDNQSILFDYIVPSKANGPTMTFCIKSDRAKFIIIIELEGLLFFLDKKTAQIIRMFPFFYTKKSN